jgi:hypothetical protein
VLTRGKKLKKKKKEEEEEEEELGVTRRGRLRHPYSQRKKKIYCESFGPWE